MFSENNSTKKESRAQNSYTGVCLNKDKKLNKDFTIISEGLFNCIEEKYSCINPIIRYSHTSEDNPAGSIELYLQKVDVLVYSINSTCTNYELLQYSKYDTVEDLFNRISDYCKNESFTLWNTKKSTKPAYSFISSLKIKSKNSKFVKIDGEEIQSTEDNIMNLGLDDERLLIIEKYCGKSCFKSANLAKNNQKTKIIKINRRKDKIKEYAKEEEEKKEQKKPKLSSKAGIVSDKFPSQQIQNYTNEKSQILTKLINHFIENDNKIQQLLESKALTNLGEQEDNNDMAYHQRRRLLTIPVNNKYGGVFTNKGICGLSNLGNTCYND